MVGTTAMFERYFNKSLKSFKTGTYERLIRTKKFCVVYHTVQLPMTVSDSYLSQTTHFANFELPLFFCND